MFKFAIVAPTRFGCGIVVKWFLTLDDFKPLVFFGTPFWVVAVNP
jgi:hypothetical protein